MKTIADQILDRALDQTAQALVRSDTSVRVGQCLLDWVACAVAGVGVRASAAVTALAASQAAHPQASIVGCGQRTSVASAALANGVISHALDFDDANLLMPGHPGVVLFPPVLALAESIGSSGRELGAAWLLGYEAGCRIGVWMAPDHYARGFHATGTIGTFASAVACAQLLGADRAQMRHAIGLAAAQASGLIGLFGTDAKPLHAGNAALHGYHAAWLACQGFTARDDALECAQGFADTHAGARMLAAALADFAHGHAVHRNLFKFHAACYGTHATLECARGIRAQSHFDPRTITSIHIEVGEECTRTCDIVAPQTEAEAKFSLRFNAAVGLLGLPTGDLATYSEAVCARADVVTLRDRVSVRFVPGRALTLAEMRVVDSEGRCFETRADTSLPMADLAHQESLLRQKFDSLVRGRMAPELANELCEKSLKIFEQSDVRLLMTFLRTVH